MAIQLIILLGIILRAIISIFYGFLLFSQVMNFSLYLRSHLCNVQLVIYI